MKIKILYNDLCAVYKKAKYFTRKSDPESVLDYIHLTAPGEDTCELVATNLLRIICIPCPCETLVSGECLIPLFALPKYNKDEAIDMYVTIESTDTNVVFEFKNDYKIIKTYPEELGKYPDFFSTYRDILPGINNNPEYLAYIKVSNLMEMLRSFRNVDVLCFKFSDDKSHPIIIESAYGENDVNMFIMPAKRQRR